MKDDTHLLFQQMGEVLSGIRSLNVTIDIRQAQAEQLYDLMRSDLTILRHDQRELEEKLNRVFWLAQSDIDALRLRSADDARALHELVSSVDGLRQPIAEVAALKARAAGLLCAVGVMGSAAVWLAEPLYRWVIDNAFQR